MQPLYVRQEDLTIVAEIKHDRVKDLERLLENLQGKVGNSDENPFRKFNQVHFVRFLILPESNSERKKNSDISNELVYSASHDGTLSDHIAEITNDLKLTQIFHQIFYCCKDYNVDGNPTSSINSFLSTHEVSNMASFQGHIGLSCTVIKRQLRIYQCIQDFLNKECLGDRSGTEIKAQILKHVKEQTSDDLDFPVVKPFHIHQAFVRWGILGLLIVPVVAAVIIAFCYWWLSGVFVLALVLAFIAYIRYIEMQAPELPATGGDFSQVSQLASREDLITQNQLSLLTPVRQQGLRLSLLKGALFLVNAMAKYSFTQGSLSGISTIHFAKWVIMDGGRRLLFFSNFDGSWENYLSDFVDRSATGLTLIWSNTENFPKTNLLFNKGAKDEERFKAWTRKYQLTTQVWYSAYGDLSVHNILRNQAISVGLSKAMSETEAITWLKLL